MADVVESPTLRALLSRRELRLRLEEAESELAPGALDETVRWVHSSDLADPTPFLSEGLVLLTTGTQFTGDEPAPYEEYVARLRERGVLGLGFGTEVVRAGIPPALAAECRAQRMPLFEVPYRTPFIAVARANAEAVAAQAYARRSWALAAQRALSLAALRPDGLDATLAELARRLGAWVGLFDASGTLTHAHPGPLAPAVAVDLRTEVGAVLRRGARAGSSLRIGGSSFSVQTLGRGGHLRGALAIAGGELDQDARGVVTAVVAMAELAFAQTERLGRAHATLRSALLEALVAGQSGLVDRVSTGLWAPLPAEPVEVALIAPGSDAVRTHLADAAPAAAAFFAATDEGVVVVASAGDPLARRTAERFGQQAGASDPSDYPGFSRALSQAREALRRGTGAFTTFAEATASGVLAGIDSDAARLRADALLAPLRAHDAEHDSRLVETLRTWLEHDARFDAAADALGVHRHTVRARVGQASRLLGSDLAGFPERAEVWAALQLSRGEAG